MVHGYETLATTSDQILRKKIFVDPIKIRNPADTFSYSITPAAIAADRNITLPLLAGDDTAVTQAFAQPLTNKTIDFASNTASNIAMYPQVRKQGIYYGTGSGNTNNCDGMWSVLGTTIAVGTGGSVGVVRATTAAGGTGWQWTTGTTINSLAGLRINSANQMSERDVNPMIQAKIKVGHITTTRFFFGFTSATGAPASAADPLNALSGVAFWYDSAVDANLHIMQNNGTGASDATTITVGAMDTAFHTYNIKAVEASTKFQYSYDGGAYTDISTRLYRQQPPD